jgi:hypothetical protein
VDDETAVYYIQATPFLDVSDIEKDCPRAPGRGDFARLLSKKAINFLRLHLDIIVGLHEILSEATHFRQSEIKPSSRH